MKKIIIIVIALIMLCGCGKKNDPTIIGKWTYEDGNYTYTFNEDKTGSYTFGDITMNFTYSIEGDKISILYPESTEPFETTFTIDGNKLNIVDSFGNDTIYIRR